MTMRMDQLRTHRAAPVPYTNRQPHITPCTFGPVGLLSGYVGESLRILMAYHACPTTTTQWLC
jgi:hypothetical protein